MARRITGREYFLIAVLVAAGGIAYYTMRGPGGASSDGDETTAASDLGDPPVVQMTRLTGTTEDYDPQGRDLFKYYTPPPPPPPAPPQRKVAAPPPQREVKPPPPRPTTPEVRGPSTPQPPRIPFQYIGLLGPKDSRIAVFEQGEEILVARAGEVLNDQFRVVEFKYEAVVMGYTDKRFSDKTTELKMKRR